MTLRHPGKLLCNMRRRIQVLSFAKLDRCTAQHKGIVEPFFNLHVKPAIDTTIDELNGKVKHDDQWQDGQSDEHTDHSRFEFGTGDVLPVVVQQTPQIADENQYENYAARDIDCEDDVLQAIEIVGALYRLGEQK